MFSTSHAPHTSRVHTHTHTHSPIVLLGSQVPSIVKVLHKQLKDKSMKTRQGCFGLLTALVTVLPGALDDHVGAIIPGILYCLKSVTGSFPCT